MPEACAQRAARPPKRRTGCSDGNGSMRKVLARQKGIDFAAGRTHGAMGIGPYHKPSLFDGTVAGQPRRARIHTDYANVQITRWARP